jgi:hypothetical protein
MARLRKATLPLTCGLGIGADLVQLISSTKQSSHSAFRNMTAPPVADPSGLGPQGELADHAPLIQQLVRQRRLLEGEDAAYIQQAARLEPGEHRFRSGSEARQDQEVVGVEGLDRNGMADVEKPEIGLSRDIAIQVYLAERRRRVGVEIDRRSAHAVEDHIGSGRNDCLDRIGIRARVEPQHMVRTVLAAEPGFVIVAASDEDLAAEGFRQLREDRAHAAAGAVNQDGRACPGLRPGVQGQVREPEIDQVDEGLPEGNRVR